MSNIEKGNLPWFVVTAGEKRHLRQGVGPIAAARALAAELDIDGLSGMVVEAASGATVRQIGTMGVEGFNAQHSIEA